MLYKITVTCRVMLFIQAAAGSVQKPDGAWIGVVAGGKDGVIAVQVYDPIEDKW